MGAAGPGGPADFLLTGAGQLVTCDPGLGEGPLGLVERGAVAATGGRVLYAGPEGSLPDLVSLAKQVEGTRMVLDHCGKPSIRGKGWDPWAEQIRDGHLRPHEVEAELVHQAGETPGEVAAPDEPTQVL